MPRVSNLPKTPRSLFKPPGQTGVVVQPVFPPNPPSASVHFMPDVQDQGEAESCVAFPVCALVSAANPGRPIGSMFGPRVITIMSASHLIDQTARVQGLCGQDLCSENFGGFQLGLLMQQAATNGIVSADQWPFDATNLTSPSCTSPLCQASPPALRPPLYKLAFAAALYLRDTQPAGNRLPVSRLENATDLIKTYIANVGLPVIAQLPVFWSAGWIAARTITMPTNLQEPAAWHAIAITDYVD